ncbi:MAG: hypothetical protein JSU03_00380 [Bacteroidetes bacterium]|nr:hypothetical protein [Bacteroidota bacterium]MBS1755707.1 hypothetical protein [Bacteroidota bacterium]
MKQNPPFIENNIYHVVNHANGNEKLFTNQENYRYFLQQLNKYITPVADFFAYALLPNHYHLMIRIKSYETILPIFLQNKKNKEIDGWLPEFVLQCFSNFQNSYAKAFNKKYQRKGALFMHPLKRVLVASEPQFSATLFYVHKNAVHHGLCSNIEDYENCSYLSLISNGPTLLLRDEVLDWFGNRESLIKFHQQPINLKNAVVLE